jgi:multicomponent Na+:H+ antiporter subunit E
LKGLRALLGIGARASSPVAVLWLLAVWLLLWGSVSPLTIVSGLVIAVGLLWATPQPPVELGLRFRPVAVVVLVAALSYDLVASSCRVSWHVLTPRLPEQAIFEVPLRLRGGLMITLVAIAVTAVPGSTVLDVYPEQGLLEIHVLDASAPGAEEKLRRDVRVLERRIAAAFGSRAERQRVAED